MFLFIIVAVFSLGMSCMDGFTYILLSVWFAWCQVFVSGKLIHALVFNCRGGGWYVMCAKSVAVTWLCVHCFDKNYVFSVSR